MIAPIRLAVATCLLTAAGAAGAIDEEQARERIEELQRQWVDAVAQGDAETIVRLYAEDAWFLPADSPPLHGRKEIREWWEKTLADPPWQEMTFGPTEIAVSDSGNWAYDVGSSRTTVAGEDGKTVEEGKYLVVWKRIDGEWKVLADAFNSN